MSVESVHTPITSPILNVETKLNDYENENNYDNTPYHIINKKKKQNETILINDTSYEKNIASTSSNNNENINETFKNNENNTTLTNHQLVKYRRKVRINLNKKLNLIIEDMEKQFSNLKLNIKNLSQIKYSFPWWTNKKHIDWSEIERRVKQNNLFKFSTLTIKKSLNETNNLTNQILLKKKNKRKIIDDESEITKFVIPLKKKVC